MSERSGKRGTLNLADARALTPPVNPVEAMRRQLSLAVFDSVKPQDVIDVVNALKEAAKKGDKAAAKMWLEFVLGKEGKPPPEPAAADGAGLKMLAEALQNMVDEIRIAKAESLATPASRKRLAAANGAHEGDE